MARSKTRRVTDVPGRVAITKRIMRRFDPRSRVRAPPWCPAEHPGATAGAENPDLVDGTVLEREITILPNAAWR